MLRLARATPDASLRHRLIDTARRGAMHVLSEARRVNGTLLLPHADAGAGRDVFYLGWCGGPAGWARLLVALYEATDEAIWLGEIAAAADALSTYVLPDLAMLLPIQHQTPWANVGQCCGAASVGTFLLRLASSRLPLALAVKARARCAALRIAALVAAHVTAAGAVPNAEEHAAPLDTRWQAGFMQGAAGVGSFLLDAHAAAAAAASGPAGTGAVKGRRIMWPDEPW